MSTVICVGGGIVGVYAALQMRKFKPGHRILLVEQDEALGGLLRSDRNDDGLWYDRGTHILSETGIADIDDALFSELPDNAWHRMGGSRRDLCGLLFDNYVEERSPFLNASSVESAHRRGSALGSGANAGNLHEYLVTRHGYELTECLFRKPIANLYRHGLQELDPFVARQLPLSRIVRDDIANWLKQSTDAAYRDWVACPEQTELPQDFASPLRSLYPRRMGVGQLFDVLTRRLRDADIEIRTSTTIANLDRADNGTVSVAMLKSNGGPNEAVSGELTIVWAASMMPLTSLLGLQTPKGAIHRGWSPIIIDFRAELSRSLKCYYYIDYGQGDGFRLTNYSAMCDEAAQQPLAPLTFEVWWRGPNPTREKMLDFVRQKLHEVGRLSGNGRIESLRIRHPKLGHLLPTHENMDWLRKLTDGVNLKAPRNIVIVGLLSKPGLFFTGDLLKNAHTEIAAEFG